MPARHAGAVGGAPESPAALWSAEVGAAEAGRPPAEARAVPDRRDGATVLAAGAPGRPRVRVLLERRPGDEARAAAAVRALRGRAPSAAPVELVLVAAAGGSADVVGPEGGTPPAAVANPTGALDPPTAAPPDAAADPGAAAPADHTAPPDGAGAADEPVRTPSARGGAALAFAIVEDLPFGTVVRSRWGRAVLDARARDHHGDVDARAAARLRAATPATSTAPREASTAASGDRRAVSAAITSTPTEAGVRAVVVAAGVLALDDACDRLLAAWTAAAEGPGEPADLDVHVERPVAPRRHAAAACERAAAAVAAAGGVPSTHEDREARLPGLLVHERAPGAIVLGVGRAAAPEAVAALVGALLAAGDEDVA